MKNKKELQVGIVHENPTSVGKLKFDTDSVNKPSEKKKKNEKFLGEKHSQKNVASALQIP